MHRHVLAVPRFVRGSHATPRANAIARDVTENALYWSKGNVDPLPYNHAETMARLAQEGSFRKHVRLAGRAATQEYYKLRRKFQLVSIPTWYPPSLPYEALSEVDASPSSSEEGRVVDPHVQAYRAEVSAGMNKSAPVYLAPDEIAELDMPVLVSYTDASHPAERQIRRDLQPAPRSRAQLHQRLLDFINAPLHRTHPRPAPPVRSLIQYHDTFPGINSTKSYNLLIEYTIRHTNFRAAYRLIIRMRTHAPHTQPNLETEKLTVRLLVRVGRWNEAWARCWTEGGATYRWAREEPFPFWLEFFAFVSPAISWGRARFWKIERSADVEANILRELLDNIPRMTGLSFENAPTRLVTSLVFHLLCVDRTEAALEVARGYLRSLPASLHARLNREAMRIIDLFVSFGYEKGMSYPDVRRTFEELVAMAPDLRPGPSSLAMVMRTLRKGRNGGRRALAFLGRARARWGTRVEDAAVRRVIARMALEDDRRDIVYAMFKRQDHYKMNRRSNHPGVITRVLFDDEPVGRDRGRQRRMPESILSSADWQGSEATKWVRLARAVERKWGRRWFEEDVRRDGMLKKMAVEEVRNATL